MFGVHTGTVPNDRDFAHIEKRKDFTQCMFQVTVGEKIREACPKKPFDVKPPSHPMKTGKFSDFSSLVQQHTRRKIRLLYEMHWYFDQQGCVDEFCSTGTKNHLEKSDKDEHETRYLTSNGIWLSYHTTRIFAGYCLLKHKCRFMQP